MNIYVQTNEQKQLTAFSSNAQDGYTRKTITLEDSYSLPQYFSLMWAEDGDGGLIHAENLPLTEYVKQINQAKADAQTLNDDTKRQIDEATTNFDNVHQQTSDALTALQGKLTEANTTIGKLGSMIAFLTASLNKAKATTETTSTTK